MLGSQQKGLKLSNDIAKYLSLHLSVRGLGGQLPVSEALPRVPQNDFRASETYPESLVEIGLDLFCDAAAGRQSTNFNLAEKRT